MFGKKNSWNFWHWKTNNVGTIVYWNFFFGTFGTKSYELVQPPTQFTSEELEKITIHVASYKKQHLECSLQPEQVIEFLEKFPTTKNKFSESLRQYGGRERNLSNWLKQSCNDSKTLYLLLKEIKPLLSSNFKRRISNFLKKVNQ